jgi:hypothetical protein
LYSCLSLRYEEFVFSFRDGVSVATDEDDTDKLLSLISICLGEDMDIVEALLGLVIFADDG